MLASSLVAHLYKPATSESQEDITVYLPINTGRTFKQDTLSQVFDFAYFKQIINQIKENNTGFDEPNKAMLYQHSHSNLGILEVKVPKTFLTQAVDSTGKLKIDLNQITQENIISLTVLETPSYRRYTITPNPTGESNIKITEKFSNT